MSCCPLFGSSGTKPHPTDTDPDSDTEADSPSYKAPTMLAAEPEAVTAFSERHLHVSLSPDSSLVLVVPASEDPESEQAVLALSMKSVRFTVEVKNKTHQPWLRKVNPSGALPCLVWKEGRPGTEADGYSLACKPEVRAIMAFLEEQTEFPRLFIRSKRGDTRTLGRKVLKVVKPAMRKLEQLNCPRATRKARQVLVDCMQSYNTYAIERDHSGPAMFGVLISAVDVLLLPYLWRLNLLKLLVPDSRVPAFKALRAYVEEVSVAGEEFSMSVVRPEERAIRRAVMDHTLHHPANMSCIAALGVEAVLAWAGRPEALDSNPAIRPAVSKLTALLEAKFAAVLKPDLGLDDSWRRPVLTLFNDVGESPVPVSLSSSIKRCEEFLDDSLVPAMQEVGWMSCAALDSQCLETDADKSTWLELAPYVVAVVSPRLGFQFLTFLARCLRLTTAAELVTDHPEVIAVASESGVMSAAAYESLGDLVATSGESPVPGLELRVSTLSHTKPSPTVNPQASSGSGRGPFRWRGSVFRSMSGDM